MLKGLMTKTRELFIKMLPNYIYEEIESRIHRENLQKGTILLEAGQLGNKVYFLEKGWAASHYYDDKSDVQIVTWILGQDNFLFSPECIFDKEVSKGTIELLEDSHIAYISLEDAVFLSDKYPVIHFLCSQTFQKQIKSYQERVRFQNMKSNEEKYKAFSKKFKEILPFLHPNIVAGYIGIHPNSLNRLLNTKRM